MFDCFDRCNDETRVKTMKWGLPSRSTSFLNSVDGKKIKTNQTIGGLTQYFEVKHIESYPFFGHRWNGECF